VDFPLILIIEVQVEGDAHNSLRRPRIGASRCAVEVARQ
jgi:hypothetical protein